MEDNQVTTQWNELRTLVEALELEAVKSDRGQFAAGVRLRKGLRLMKKQADLMVKFTKDREKVLRGELAAKKTSVAE